MKKIAIILLMILYLIPTIGITVSSHHCGGKITSVSLKLLDFGHKCPCGKRPMKKNCCKDEAKTFKLKAEQQKAHQLAFKVFKTFTIQPALAESFTFCYQQPLVLKEFSTAYHPPPDDVKHPLYIHHCVFRI